MEIINYVAGKLFLCTFLNFKKGRLLMMWWPSCERNKIYTPLKRTFNKLQFRRGSIFIRLAIVGSQIATTREIPREFVIQPCSSSRSSKVIDFGVNRKRIYDFLLVINSNFVYRLSTTSTGQKYKKA